MIELYKTFASDWAHVLDFSDDAMLELYNNESYGTKPPHPKNGFAHGKKWLNVHVTMWKEDMADGTLFRHELYEDPKFPHWWLDKVLK